MNALQVKLDAQGAIDWDQWVLDGTIVRAHRVAAPNDGPDGSAEPSNHALGRSIGGFSTTIHLLSDGNGLPLDACLTPGQTHESTQAETVLEKFQKLIPYFNTDHSALTWDQVVGLVGSGKAGMTLMGTWAIGAFTKGSNWQPGVDFGAVTFPQEPERVLLFHPDTYGLTTKAPHAAATRDWLKVVASPGLQIPTDVT